MCVCLLCVCLCVCVCVCGHIYMCVCVSWTRGGNRRFVTYLFPRPTPCVASDNFCASSSVGIGALLWEAFDRASCSARLLLLPPPPLLYRFTLETGTLLTPPPLLPLLGPFSVYNRLFAIARCRRFSSSADMRK